MADSKTTALTDVVTVASGDLLPLVDISDTTMSANGTNKKATIAELMVQAPVQSVAGKTGAVTLAEADVANLTTDLAAKYSASNTPPYPVTTVAGKTGAVTLVEADIASLTTDLAAKVPTTTTVNGHALSSNVTVTANDVLPSQATFSGKFLTTDGTNSSWATAGGGGGTDPNLVASGFIGTGTGGTGGSTVSRLDMTADGNTDVAYRLVYSLLYDNSADVLMLQFNSNTSGYNWQQSNVDAGATIIKNTSTLTGSYLYGIALTGVGVGSSNYMSSGEVIIAASNYGGYNRYVRGVCVDHTTDYGRSVNVSGIWTNTTSNITTISLFTRQNTTFTHGIWRLYKI
jgi:hypothetical protein